jgi:hypothetical protein
MGDHVSFKDLKLAMNLQVESSALFQVSLCFTFISETAHTAYGCEW